MRRTLLAALVLAAAFPALAAKPAKSAGLRLDPVRAIGISPGYYALAWGEVSVEKAVTAKGEPPPELVFREGVASAASTERLAYIALGGGEVAVYNWESERVVDRIPAFGSDDATLAAATEDTAILAAPSGEVALFHRGGLAVHLFLPGEALEVRAGDGRGSVLVKRSKDGALVVYTVSSSGAVTERRRWWRDGEEWGWDGDSLTAYEGGYLERGWLRPATDATPPKPGRWIREPYKYGQRFMWINVDERWRIDEKEYRVQVYLKHPWEELIEPVSALRHKVRGLIRAEGLRHAFYASDDGYLWKLVLDPWFHSEKNPYLKGMSVSRRYEIGEGKVVWPMAYRDDVLAGYLDGHLYLWEMPAFEPIGKPVKMPQPSALAIDPDGEVLVGGMFGGVYARKGGVSRTLVEGGTGAVVRIFAWRNAAGKKRVVVVGERQVVYIPEDAPRATLKVPAGMSVLDAALSIPGKRLVLVGDEIAYVDLPITGESAFERLRPPASGWLTAVDFVSDSPGEHVVAIGTSKGEVVFFDLDQAVEVARLGGFLASVQWVVTGYNSPVVAFSAGRTCCPGAVTAETLFR